MHPKFVLPIDWLTMVAVQVVEGQHSARAGWVRIPDVYQVQTSAFFISVYRHSAIARLQAFFVMVSETLFILLCILTFNQSIATICHHLFVKTSNLNGKSNILTLSLASPQW